MSYEATSGRSTLPDVVAAALAEVARPLGYLYPAAAARGEVAAVVTAPGVRWPALRVPFQSRTGVQCAVLPLLKVADLAVREAPSVAQALEEPVEPGEMWCLVLWRDRGEPHATLVPMRLTTTLARGST